MVGNLTYAPTAPLPGLITPSLLGIGNLVEAPINVLIAEDFPAFRELLCSILQRRPDCHVGWQAPDGLEAVERSEKLQPDLILLDIGLPTLNGIEAARRIRKVSPNSRILFVSCESSAEVVQEALGVGAHGYLLKSDALELPMAINAVLQGKRFLSSRLAKNKQQAPFHAFHEYVSPERGSR